MSERASEPVPQRPTQQHDATTRAAEQRPLPGARRHSAGEQPTDGHRGGGQADAGAPQRSGAQDRDGQVVYSAATRPGSGDAPTTATQYVGTEHTGVQHVVGPGAQQGVPQQGTAQQATTQQGTTQQGTAQQGTAQQGMTQQGTAQQAVPAQRTSREAGPAHPGRAQTGPSQARDRRASGGGVPTERARAYGARWDAVKVSFVDEPRKAVEQADALVRELVEDLLRDQRRSASEGAETSTEDLRMALLRYRGLFDRLLDL